MLDKNVLNEIGSKVNEILASSPARDVEKNMRAMLTGAFARLDLVTREEFDVQQEVIKRTRIKLAELEEKYANWNNNYSSRQKWFHRMKREMPVAKHNRNG